MLEGVLAAICNYLQVNTAFVAALSDGSPEIVTAIGTARPKSTWIREEGDSLREILLDHKPQSEPMIQAWHSYWVVPLYSKRMGYNGTNGTQNPIGIVAI